MVCILSTCPVVSSNSHPWLSDVLKVTKAVCRCRPPYPPTTRSATLTINGTPHFCIVKDRKSLTSQKSITDFLQRRRGTSTDSADDSSYPQYLGMMVADFGGHVGMYILVAEARKISSTNFFVAEHSES